MSESSVTLDDGIQSSNHTVVMRSDPFGRPRATDSPAPSNVGGGDRAQVRTMRVAVLASRDVQDDTTRLPAILKAIGLTCAWRYRVRFAMCAASFGEHQDPAGPFNNADAVLLVVGDEIADGLLDDDRELLPTWLTAHASDVLVLARRRPTYLASVEAALGRMRALRFLELVEPLARVRAYQTSEQLCEEVRAGLAHMAHRHWQVRNGIGDLICCECGFKPPTGVLRGCCPICNEVLLLENERSQRGRDCYLGRHLMGGRYVINGRIGEGAQASVYFALQQPVERPVAVKIYPPQHDEDSPRATHEANRFMRETRFLDTLKHPNIPDIRDTGVEPDGTRFLVMDHLRGRTLKSVLTELPPRVLVDVAVDLLSAIAAVHDAGLVHRDIKPGNVMICDDPHNPHGPPMVQLIDFGIGKMVGDSELTALTLPGSVVGTFNYMAPERFTDHSAVDRRADIYSVGAILYYGLSGAPPFNFNGIGVGPGASPLFALVGQVIHEPPRPLERSDLPPSLVHIVERALAKAPADRFADALAMRDALAEVARHWNCPDQQVAAKLATNRRVETSLAESGSTMEACLQTDPEAHAIVVDTAEELPVLDPRPVVAAPISSVLGDSDSVLPSGDSRDAAARIRPVFIGFLRWFLRPKFTAIGTRVWLVGLVTKCKSVASQIRIWSARRDAHSDDVHGERRRTSIAGFGSRPRGIPATDNRGFRYGQRPPQLQPCVVSAREGDDEWRL